MGLLCTAGRPTSPKVRGQRLAAVTAHDLRPDWPHKVEGQRRWHHQLDNRRTDACAATENGCQQLRGWTLEGLGPPERLLWRLGARRERGRGRCALPKTIFTPLLRLTKPLGCGSNMVIHHEPNHYTLGKSNRNSRDTLSLISDFVRARHSCERFLSRTTYAPVPGTAYRSAHGKRVVRRTIVTLAITESACPRASYCTHGRAGALAHRHGTNT